MNHETEAQRHARRERLVRRVGRVFASALGGLGFLIIAGHAMFFVGAGGDLLLSPGSLTWQSIAFGLVFLGYATHLIYMIVLAPLAPQSRRSAVALNLFAALLFIGGFVSSLGSLIRGSLMPFDSALPYLILAFFSAVMVSVSILIAAHCASTRHAV